MNVIGVTNRKLCADFYKRIEEIAKKDLQYLILREKDLLAKDLEIMALKVMDILKGSGMGLIINGNLGVAKKVEAAGVQLSFRDFIKGKSINYDGVVGVSIHSFEEAIEVDNRGASYMIYGHIFETDCKKGVLPRGLKEFKAICESVTTPVYAIGGITKENAQFVMDSGAYGVAYMSSLMKGKRLE
ncbi:thiamine phosphate synthase [Clostridium sp. HBUAS56017]|uniref:thiamine phosphate synthase n=1 Tax=Clostridium sp. HBUAS56017 TaxID=2571128 RepID=UPI0011785A67|nr:thiamine phosphate synthase [Clostridium sp. HBUAS56017]